MKKNALIGFEALAGLALLCFTLWSSVFVQEWRKRKRPVVNISQ